MRGYPVLYPLTAAFLVLCIVASLPGNALSAAKQEKTTAPSAVTRGSATPLAHQNTEPAIADQLKVTSAEGQIAQYTYWLDVATGVLAFFTFILAIVGGVEIYYLIRTDRSTRDSAEAARLGAIAAKESADSTKASVELSRMTFLSANRPRIRVKHVWLERGINDDGALTLTLVIVNQGASDASINELRIGCCLTGGEGQIVDRLLEKRPRRLLKQTLQSGITLILPELDGGLSLDKQQSMNARGGSMALYCVGDIQYVDELGRTRKTAFARRWHNGRFRSLEKPDSDYEYED